MQTKVACARLRGDRASARQQWLDEWLRCHETKGNNWTSITDTGFTVPPRNKIGKPTWIMHQYTLFTEDPVNKNTQCTGKHHSTVSLRTKGATSTRGCRRRFLHQQHISLLNKPGGYQRREAACVGVVVCFIRV